MSVFPEAKRKRSAKLADLRRVVSAASAFTLMSGFLTGLAAAPAASAAPPPDRNESSTVCGVGDNPIVSFLSDPTFWFNTSSSLDSQYIGYSVQAPSGKELRDVWVQITGFTGGLISLAPQQPGWQSAGDLPAGETASTFFLARLSALRVSTVPQGHTVNVYSGNPNLGTSSELLCSGTNSFTAIDEAGLETDNKISTVSMSPNIQEVGIGATVKVTVTGNTGPIGAGAPEKNGLFSWAPAARSNFPASSWRLISTELTTSAGTYSDLLYRGDAVADQGDYTVEYTFLATNTSPIQTSLSPISYVASGEGVFATGSVPNAPPLLPRVVNNLLVSTSPSAATLPNAGGTLAYTTTVTNVGDTGASITSLYDALPLGSSYVPGSARLDGETIPDPTVRVADGRESIIFAQGRYPIPSKGSTSFRYSVNFPAGYGTWDNTATAAVSATQIDANSDTGDSLPASTIVTVAPPSPNFSSVSPTTVGTNPITFVPSITGSGPGFGSACIISGSACVTMRTIAGQGTYVVNPGSGTVTFTAVPGYTGTTTPVAYSVTDQYQEASTTNLTVIVTRPPAPIVSSVTASTAFRTQAFLTPGVSPAVDMSTACLISGASCAKTITTNQGSWAVGTTGEVTFTPGLSHTGPVLPVTYRVTDEYGRTASNTISLTVGAPPAITLSVPSNTNVAYMQERHIQVGVTSGDAGAFCLVSGTACQKNLLNEGGAWSVNEATGEITFTAGNNFSGITQAIVRARGAANTSGQAAVKVTVATPPTPTAATGGSNARVTGSFGSTLLFTTQLTSTAGVNQSLTRLRDPGDGQWKVTVAVPGQGTYSVNRTTGVISFTPALEFTGETTPIDLRVTNASGQQTTGTVGVTINLPTPPTAANTQTQIPYGSVVYQLPRSLTGTAIQPNLARLQDPADNQWKNIVRVSGQGTWQVFPYAGKVQFSPERRNFQGSTAPIAYRVQDKWGQTDTVQLTAIVQRPAPPVVSIASLSYDYSQQVAFKPTIIGVDPQYPAARFRDPADNTWKTNVTISGQGTWTSANGQGNITFTGVPSFAGETVPMVYRIADLFGQTGQNNISINRGIASPPLVVPATTSTVGYQAPNVLSLPGWVSESGVNVGSARLRDPSDNQWKTLVNIPNQGTLQILTGSGRVSFTGLRSFVGNTTPIAYRIANASGATAQGNLAFTVQPAQQPSVSPSTVGKTDPGALGSVQPTIAGANINTSVTCFKLTPSSSCTRSAGTAQGTWSITNAGRIAFTPSAGWIGQTDTVYYQITDGFGRTALGPVKFWVGQRVFTYFPTASSSTVTASMREQLSTFAINLLGVPERAIVRVSATLPPNPTNANITLASSRADAIISELNRIGVPAVRGPNINGASISEAAGVRVTSSYDTSSLVAAYTKSSFAIGSDREQFAPVVVGGTGNSPTFSVTGTLPTGVAFNTSTGTFTGPPSSAWTSTPAQLGFPANLTVTVNDGVNSVIIPITLNAINPPSSPRNLVANPGNGRVSLLWGAPSQNGGAPVTGYNIYFATSPQGPWSQYLANTPSQSANILGLSNGVEYWFRVTAVNLLGEGDPATVGPVNPADVPSAPRNLTATPGDERVLLAWEVPESNGGDPISGYTVYYANQADGPWTIYAASVAETEYMVEGLINGEEYWFMVEANNSVGAGEPAITENGVIPARSPSEPTEFLATPGNSEVTLTWQPPYNDGGESVLGYNVYVSTSEDGPWSTVTAGTTFTTVKATNLTNGTPYWFKVEAYNRVGVGPAALAATIPATAPSAPQNLVGVAGNSEVSLSWEAPANDGGAAVSGYSVYYATSSSGPWVEYPGEVTDTNVTVQELDNGSSYWFEVKAKNQVGYGPAAKTTQGIRPGAAPTAPRNLSASSGDKQVSLTWEAPQNSGGSEISGYTVYTATEEGGPWTLYATGITATSANVTGLTNGTGYWFQVTATNLIGEGTPAFTLVPTVPASVPSEPQNLTANAGNAAVELSWEAPSEDGGYTLEGYTVYYSTSGIGPWEVYVAGITETTINVTGLENGTGYWFEVTATNLVGEGPAAVTPEPVIPVAVPSPPTALEGTQGNEEVSLTWAAPLDNGGSPIVGYTIFYSNNENGPWVQYASGIENTFATVSGLENGTPYWFEVTANNSTGESLPSDAAGPYIPATVPSAPLSFAAEPGNTTVLLSWATPASDGGNAIAGYTVSYAESESGPWAEYASGLTENSLLVTDLSNGTSYWFRVAAANDVGIGQAAQTAEPVVPRALPTAPQNLLAMPGDQEVSLTWEPPLSSGGSAIAGYTVYLSESSEGPWTLIVADVTGTSSNVTGLANGTSYWFQVTATNAVGEGPGAVSDQTIPAAPPSAPINLNGSPSNEEVALTWEAPADNGGYPVEGYNVYYATTQGGPWETYATGVLETSSTINGLANGTPYWFKVTAVSQAGEGAGAFTAQSLTPVAVPSAPSNLIANPGDKEVEVSWTTPANDGGTSITGYAVSYATSPGGPWELFSDKVAGTTETVTGLTNGTNYWFQVYAYNGVGNGPTTTTTEPVIPATVPSAPLSFTAIPENTQITLDWVAPNDDGGYPVTGYTVYYSTSAGGSYELYASDITATELLVSGLVNGTEYWFQVAANNFLGEGAKASLGPETPTTLPSAPINLLAVPSGGQVALTWEAPVSDGGSPILGYNTYYATSAEGPWTLANANVQGTSDVVGGLTNGVSYWFRVNASTEVGNGPPAETTEPVVPATVPSEPVNLAATPGSNEVSLSWEPPSDNGGYEVSGYSVYYATSSSGPFELYASDIQGTSIPVIELTNGTSYWFQVTASNLLGEGSAANAGPETPGTVPTAPQGLTATPGNTEVTLNWSPPESDGGYPISGYTVYYSTSETGPWVTHATGIAATTSTVTALTNGLEYWFKVTANNAAGESPGAIDLAVPATLPGTPENLNGYAGNAEATLSWSEPSSDGGAVLTGYTVYYGTSATGPWAEYSSGSLDTTVTVIGLENETQYWFQVTATNLIGTGPAATFGPLLPTSVPSEPTNFTATSGNKQVGLTWDAPLDDGGAPITGYNVYYAATETGPWTTHLAGTPNTSTTVTGLTNGTGYWFMVEAVTVRGDGTPAMAQATPAGPPEAPSEVILSPENSQIVVTWPVPSDEGSPITGYTVSRGTSATGPWTEIATGLTNNETTATGLSNGTAYWFRVTATNALGTSPATVGGPATPRTTPTAPQNLSAVAGNTQVSLTWTAPSSNGGAAIYGYNVYYATSAGGPWIFYQFTSDLSDIAVTGLTNNTSYWFQVRAVNEAGEGSPATVGPRIPVALPTAPQNLSATAGNAQVSLSWQAPSNPGSSPVTGYKVYRSTSSSSGPWTYLTQTANTSYLDSPLSNGTSYWFQVTAVSNVGEGPGAVVGPRTPMTAPGPPRNISLTPDNGQITVSWDPPTDNGGSATLSYNVYRSTTSSSGPWTLTALNVGCCSRTITGLVNGTSYWFQVTASNPVGEGPGTSAGPAVPFIPSRTPSEPRSLSSSPGNTQVSLSWVSPSDSGSSPVTGYNVYRSTSSSSGPWTYVTQTASTSNLVSSLANGTSYWFRVCSVNAVGEGGCSVVGPVTPRTTPGAPSSISTSAGNAQVTVSWSAPSSNGGAAVTSYNVYYSTSSGGPWTLYATGVACCSRTVSPLTNGIAYWFRVSANNEAGEGTPITTSTSTTPGPPASPSLTWSSSTSSSVAVDWSSVANASYYTCSATAGSASISGNRCNVTGMSADTSVTVSVSACNSSGACSNASSVSAASNPIAPSSVSFTYNGQSTDGGNRSATINWSGGTAGTYYVIANGSQLTSSSSSSYTFASALASTSYSFSIQVRNRASGSTTATVNASNNPLSAAPFAPSGLTASAGRGTQSPLSVPISITWSSTANATSYRLLRSDAFSYWTTFSPSYADSGLSWATTYTYKVMACGTYGCSTWSSNVSERTAPAPALWSVSKSGTTATVNVAGMPSGAASWRVKWCDRTANSGCNPDDQAGGSSWFTSAGSQNVTGLISGRRYAFAVISASGSSGQGPQTLSSTQAAG